MLKKWISWITTSRAPSRTVVNWLSQPDIDQSWSRCDIGAYQNEHRAATTEELTRGFFETLGRQLRQVDLSSVTINTSLVPNQQTIGLLDIRRTIGTVTVLTDADADLKLQNLRIGQLICHTGGVKLRIVDCDISRFHVHARAVDVRTTDTNIGSLDLSDFALRHFEMERGSLLNVQCPPPDGDNPFTGTVVFRNVFFPRDRKNYLLEGAQPYRNLRHHLRSLENAQMANLLHSAELAVERQDDTWPNRVISWLYELFSDFGSSALRPLLWLIGFVGVSFVWTYMSAGAVLASEEKLIGWQEIFLRKDCAGDVLRSLYLAFQPIANPIGIFGKDPILVARFPSLAIWLSIQGMLSVVLIALTIFAIRRRFKIS